MSDERSENNFDKEKLAFPKATVTRLMKSNIDSDKRIQDRVKVEMNRFLERIVREVCFELNKYPYTTVDYEMFKESVYPYTNIREINEERERILVQLDEIKSDCDSLAGYVEKTLKLNDASDDNIFFY